jgi:2C-methyl-D-erythritol 2,4-cyclodiphosphate synthase
MLQQVADKMDELLDNIYKYIFGHTMTQMTATAGIKKHGQAAVDALLQEFCQLDSKNVFETLDASALTASQKQEVLRAVNLIKEKRSGKLKVQIYKERDKVSHGIHGRSHDFPYD